MASVKSKKKNPWLMPALLVVAIAALFAVYKVMDAQNRTPAADTGSSVDVTMILERDIAEVSALSYTWGGETNSFTWNTTTGLWVCEGDKSFPLVQEPLTVMANAVCAIGVYRTLDTGDNGSYGLETPAAEFTVTFTDGTAHSFAIGDVNPVSDYRYLLEKSTGKVHTINAALLPYFQYTLADLFSYDALPSDIEVNYLSSAVLKTPTGEKKTDDAEALKSLFTRFQLLKPAQYADWSGTDAAVQKYGIGASSLTLNYKRAAAVTDTSGNEITTRISTSYTVRFGNVLADGRIPYMIGDSHVIYLTDSADLDSISDCFG